MLDRLVEIFCDMDDFCNAFFPSVGSAAAKNLFTIYLGISVSSELFEEVQYHDPFISQRYQPHTVCKDSPYFGIMP